MDFCALCVKKKNAVQRDCAAFAFAFTSSGCAAVVVCDAVDYVAALPLIACLILIQIEIDLLLILSTARNRQSNAVNENIADA